MPTNAESKVSQDIFQSNYFPTGSHKYPNAVERFWSMVDKNGSIPEHRPELGNCWVWKSVSKSHPYGELRVNGKKMKAHRFSYILHFGKIPDGHGSLHKCDNCACVRPEHLFSGNQSANMMDCFSKGRTTRPKGENHPESKLTNKKVFEIKKMIKNGFGTKQIAKKFNVVLGTIGHIKAGRSWTHIRT